MQELLKRYERRGVFARAMLWGSVVSVGGFVLDAILHHFALAWFRERLVGNIVEGLLFMFLVWAFIRAREKRVQQRFREVGYLNHHIRNALLIILLAHNIEDTKARAEVVQAACVRIQLCLEKVSRHEDCDVDNGHPQTP